MVERLLRWLADVSMCDASHFYTIYSIISPRPFFEVSRSELCFSIIGSFKPGTTRAFQGSKAGSIVYSNPIKTHSLRRHYRLNQALGINLILQLTGISFPLPRVSAHYLQAPRNLTNR